MRIITGKAKGPRLYTLEGEDVTRPTTERVKEAIFSMIQFEIEGRRILDLFAGSGQLGLEAMSRGAEYVMFVDSSRDAMGIVKKNAEKTHLFDKCGYLVTDYRSYLRKNGGEGKFDVVFLDPPYKSECMSDALVKLHEYRIIKTGGMCVCESEDADLFDRIDGLADRYEIVKKNGYGRVQIALLRPKYEEACDE